jgi:uncharacterized protein (DUF58 family)
MQTIDRLKLANFGNLELLAKTVVEGFITGMHKSPFHGFSVEFAEHRLYNKGESTRHLDWKLLARTEKLFTKKYEEETNLRCQIVIDNSSSMLFKGQNDLSKIEFSVYAAASLIELLKKQRDAVGLTLFTDKLNVHTPAKSSMAHHRYLMNEMEKLLVNYQEKIKKNTNIVNALHDVAELCHRRSMVLIFTDYLDDPTKENDFFQALQHLKHNKHEVVVFHVINNDLEINFNFENRPYNIIDMETGEQIKLNPSSFKEKYNELINVYFERFKQKCTQYKIDYVFADTEKGYHQILTSYLIKRSKMM